MKRLVVLLDFSKYSSTLVDFAFAWKDMFGFDLTFIHQVPGMIPTLTDTSGRRQILEYEKSQATKQFFELLKSKDLEPKAVAFIPTEKQLKQYLISFLKPNDILFLGIKGTGFLKKLLIGSTATEIIDEINQMTLAIPPKIDSVKPENLVIGLHHKYPINKIELKKIINLFDHRVKNIELLSVVSSAEDRQKSEEYLLTLKQQVGAAKSPEIKIFEGTDTFGEIKSYIINRPNTYFIVQKGSRTLNDKMFRKFLINDLIHDGSIPLIILPS